MKQKLARFFTAVFLAFAVLVCMFGPMMVFAHDSGACYSIQDGDARTYCLARAHREPGKCYSIRRADLRAQCLAEVRK